MHLTQYSLLVIILVGIIAGFLAGRIVRGFGFGLIGDLVVGILGAFVGNWLFKQLHIAILPGNPIIAEIIAATVGAIVLLLIVGLVGGGRRRW